MNALRLPDGARPALRPQCVIQQVVVTAEQATMWTQLRMTITASGATQAIKRAGQPLAVLRKQSGKWRIACDANLLVTV